MVRPETGNSDGPDDGPSSADVFHAVRFYEDDDLLCRLAADYLDAGLSKGQPAIAIATRAHSSAILRELGSKGLDVEALQAAGDLLVVDAREMVSHLVHANSVDLSAFNARIGGLLEATARARPDCRIHVYGEMVDVLWRDGMHQAAVQLEMLWNTSFDAHNFSLLCSYSMGFFHKDASYDVIRNTHTHEIVDSGPGAIGALHILR